MGATGVLGTRDNNHLDLYTNNGRRARLTRGGNLIVGDTTDTGQKVQVKGRFYQKLGRYRRQWFCLVGEYEQFTGDRQGYGI